MTGCDLCAAQRITERVHDDSECWVADCVRCRVPMVVWKRHGTTPDPAAVARMIAALEKAAGQRFGSHSFRIDRQMRSIPDHFHAHARPSRARREPSPPTPDGEPAVGWRYWGSLEKGPDGLWGLTAPTVVRSLTGDTGDSRWTSRTMTSSPCWSPIRNEHQTPVGPVCMCGLFAYRTLEDLALVIYWQVPALTLVSGNGGVYWSVSDHQRGAWRAERQTIEKIVLPDTLADAEAEEIGRQFEVPVLRAPLGRPWPGRWVEMLRWAEANDLPNLWRDGSRPLVGRAPAGHHKFPIHPFPPVFSPSKLRQVVQDSDDASGMWWTMQLAREASVFGASWLTSNMAVGGVATPELDLVARCGFTHVLDCRAETDSTESAQRLGLVYERAPAVDDGRRQPVEWFERGVSFAEHALAQPAAKLLIHCAGGIHRGPSMAYAVLRCQGETRVSATAKILNAVCFAPSATPTLTPARYRPDAEVFIEARSHAR